MNGNRIELVAHPFCSYCQKASTVGTVALIAMPGLGVGGIRLQDGTKALLAVTDRRKVLHLPTRDGYDVLASVKEPVRLLEELRSGAGV